MAGEGRLLLHIRQVYNAMYVEQKSGEWRMSWKYLDESTVAAISTPAGEGGIGVVRVSGPKALSILASIFRDKHGFTRTSFDTHRMYSGTVVSKEGEMIDQVLAVAMLSPHSYTGEDVVEVHCHGGSVVLRSVLELTLKEGARSAGPGEFTKRAFLNGKLDLAQAESVIDVIRSKTKQSLKMALSGLSGRLSARISTLRDHLMQILAHIEAGIDFPEDDVGEIEMASICETLESTISDVEGMIQDAKSGKAYRDGVSVVVAGRPNVGKSSVFNAIVREHRAIVTEIPGTTRDVIEEYVSMSGVPVRLMDTAGIRDTEDLVEREGVNRSRKSLDEADIVLYVVDASDLSRDEGANEDMKMLSSFSRDETILVLNKIDLVSGILETPFGAAAPRVVVRTSAVTGAGFGELEKQIVQMVVRENISAGEAVVTNVRHEDALRRSQTHLEDALDAVRQKTPLDLVVIDVREGLSALGEITGDTVGEDVVDRIFADFCVGK